MFLGGSKGNIGKERVKIERPCSIIFLAVQKCTIYFYPVLLYLLQSFVFFLLSATTKIFAFLKIAGNTKAVVFRDQHDFLNFASVNFIRQSNWSRTWWKLNLLLRLSLENLFLAVSITESSVLFTNNILSVN